MKRGQITLPTSGTTPSYLPRLDRLQLFHQKGRSDVGNRAQKQEEPGKRLGKGGSLARLESVEDQHEHSFREGGHDGANQDRRLALSRQICTGKTHIGTASYMTPIRSKPYTSVFLDATSFWKIPNKPCTWLFLVMTSAPRRINAFHSLTSAGTFPRDSQRAAWRSGPRRFSYAEGRVVTGWSSSS